MSKIIEKKVNVYIKNIIKYLKENSKYENIDIAQIDLLEDSYRTFLFAKQDIEKDGYFLLNRFGDKIPNPAIKVSNDAKIQINKVLELMNIVHKLRYKNTVIEDDDSLLDNWDKEG